MSHIYVTGGRQKKRILMTEEEWNLYERGLILRIDTDTGASMNCVDYETPPEARADKSFSVLFHSGTLEGNKLSVCTSTEVLLYQIPEFKRIGYVSLPCFNDLHHVRPTPGGTLLVASTGLDMVVEVTLQGEILREWSVLGEDPWRRFSRKNDYRKIPTTKPHLSHPNFVFQLGNDVWVTRGQQRDAVCLTSPDQRIDIRIQFPHDGLVCGDWIYFTTVDGHVVVVDRSSLQVAEVFDLNTMGNENRIVLGWCRGLLPLDKGKIWVGFTRIRKTKLKENINWVKHSFQEVEKPTHLALYDLERKKCLREIDLEALGLNIVFGIFPALPI